jgi:hypothetical protein
MAGQGRNADGLIGSERRDAVNVVRFPGDWFGPVGDLVPIGTDPDGAQEPDLLGAEPDDIGADSFWSEDAEAAHRVGAPAVGSPPHSRPRWMVLPIGTAVAGAVALVVVLSAGTGPGGRGRVIHGRRAQPSPAINARPHDEPAVTTVSTAAAVRPEPGDLASPTGLVSPPPNASLTNP